MQTFDADLLRDDPIGFRLLAEYHEAMRDTGSETARPSQPQGPRWVPRIRSLPELDPEELSAAHGRLIALGLLNFQLEDRTSGLAYRLSAEGRACLAVAEGPSAD